MNNPLFSIIGWIITGSVAGYIASLLLKAERQGCLVNIILGVLGAFVGGFVVENLLGFHLTGVGFIDTIFSATIGAVIVLLVIEFLLPGKQLGRRGGDGAAKGRGRRRRR